MMCLTSSIDKVAGKKVTDNSFPQYTQASFWLEMSTAMVLYKITML